MKLTLKMLVVLYVCAHKRIIEIFVYAGYITEPTITRALPGHEV